MSFFNHVQLHKYDLTDKGVSQACRDEIVAEMGDAYVHLTDKQLDILADHMREAVSYTHLTLPTTPYV